MDHQTSGDEFEYVDYRENVQGKDIEAKSSKRTGFKGAAKSNKNKGKSWKK